MNDFYKLSARNVFKCKIFDTYLVGKVTTC